MINMAEDLIMDAAHKIFRTAILSATALLLANAGLAQTPVLQAPTSVALFGTGGQNANITSSGAAIDFTIGAPVYASDDGNWLSVSGGTTTPATLSFNLARAPFTEGVKQATVTLTPSAASGAAAVTITVTYTSGTSGGGGSSVLSANPNPVNFNLGANSTSVQTPVAISTTGSVNQTIQSAVANVNWLSVQVTNPSVVPSSPGGIALTASSVGLQNSTYNGTVTVTPSTGAALTINVSLTVGGGSGTGNWSVSPSSTVSWSYTTGGTFPNQLFLVTPPNGANFYNVVGVNSSNGWLLVADVNNNQGTSYPNVPVSQGFYLKAGSNVAALGQGTYTGLAYLTDSSGSNPLTITVNLTVNGGNSTGLTVTPNPLAFNSNVNGGLQSAVVTLSSNTGGNVAVAASGVTPSWLTATGPSPVSVLAGQTATFTVSANPSGLAAGTYTGDIAVSIGSQSAILNVRLVVGGGGGGGGTGTSAVAPTALQFAYQIGTPPTAIAQQRLVITGPAGPWTATVSSSSASWLKVTPGSGSSLPNPEAPGDAPVVSIDPTGLGANSYSGQITITAPGGNTTIQVSLNVLTSTILVPTPGSLIFSAQTGQAKPGGQLVFVSYSDNSLNLSTSPVTAVSNSDWITLTGPTQNGVTVNVDQTGKSTGVYTGSITFNSSAGTGLVTVPVVMVVNGGGSGGGGGGSGSLTFSQSSFAFSATNGFVTPVSSTLTVSAASATSFVGTITYQPNNVGNWLSVTPLSGVTNTNLSLTANASGLANGTYNATISFNVNGVVQTVAVSLTVGSSGGGNTGNVNVSPTSLSFTAQPGNNPAVQSLSVTSASGTAGIGFTVQVSTNGGANWLSTSAGVNNSAPSTLTVTVNSAALAAGTYTGNIQIQPNGGATVNVPVTLTVTSPPTVSATPNSLFFEYRLGDTAPAPKALTVSGGGGALTFSATPSSNGNWLAVSPATGTTPGTVNVSINPSAFTSTGEFNGTVTVAGTGGATGSTTVAVKVTVTAPLPTLSRVTNAASYASGSISPGEIVTLFAADPTHPIGPTTAVGLTLDSTGKVATKIGNVEVLINGFASPMIYASATQVAAVVPYELKLFTSATVVVRFLGQTSNGVSVNVATTQPGIFTANASGTGPGAIANSNGSPNSASNPATRGDTIVLYLTGEGETSPAGVTGKVTTVASPPAPLTPAPLLPVSVTIAGQPANWSFAGEAPGFVSGVMQLNVVVPTGIPGGEQPIQVTIGGNPSQTGVTVSLR